MGAEHRRAAALADAAGRPWARNVAAADEPAHDSGRVKRDEVCVSCLADAVAVRDAVPRVVLDADAGAAGDVRQRIDGGAGAAGAVHVGWAVVGERNHVFLRHDADDVRHHGVCRARANSVFAGRAGR